MSQSLSPARISLTPTTARIGRGGLIVALLLHAALVATTLFSWQHHLDIADETPPVVPVDLVTIADKTNIIPAVTRAPKPQPKVDETPQPVAPPTPAPPPPPEAEAAPAEPAPKPPQAKPEPAPKPETKPQKPAPQKPDEKKKPKSDDFSALLNKLTAAPAAAPHNARIADRNIKGVGAMNAMTADLVDALRSQIAQCWSPPVGAPHPEQLRPAFHFQLNRDGTVVGVPQLTADSAADAAGNPFMRAAAEAGRRAIMTCQPYKLPPDKYDTWRDITSLDFDPSKMVQ
jgi:hypothetical protein